MENGRARNRATAQEVEGGTEVGSQWLTLFGSTVRSCVWPVPSLRSPCHVRKPAASHRGPLGQAATQVLYPAEISSLSQGGCSGSPDQWRSGALYL